MVECGEGDGEMRAMARQERQELMAQVRVWCVVVVGRRRRRGDGAVRRGPELAVLSVSPPPILSVLFKC